jgi:D-sedoheptulose 7-phosphate isomerase
MSAEETIASSLKDLAGLCESFPRAQVALVAKAAGIMAKAVAEGHKVIWFGNGGSATQGQHMAGEFVGRFLRERRALPSISLTENMASVTAIANDYAFEQIFSRQLEGLASAGDVAVGLSTSGNSPNVIQGLRTAKALGLPTIGMTGGAGGQMAGLCDVCLCVSSKVTARIQEVHLAIGHILCGLVEDAIR